MTIKQYKAQPFKYGSNAEPILISEIWPELKRRDRREIERLVKKGKNPNVMDYYYDTDRENLESRRR